MMPWRMSMTVLTDLSASMFAACFMILLIFLSLVQKNGPAASERPPVEASQAFMLTTQTVLSPAAMVDHLYAYGRDGTSLDLFADRVELFAPGRKAAERVAGGDLASRLASLSVADLPVRLQVFSNNLYNQVLRGLEAGGTEFAELTIPAGLRDPERPNLAWTPGFLQLGDQATDRQAFRIALAALLQGAADRAAVAKGGAGGQAPALTTPSLLDRLAHWIDHVTRVVFPLAGLACVLWIERRRFGAIRDR